MSGGDFLHEDRVLFPQRCAAFQIGVLLSRSVNRKVRIPERGAWDMVKVFPNELGQIAYVSGNNFRKVAWLWKQLTWTKAA